MSHCNSLDFDENSDALLIPYDVSNSHKILIIPDVSNVLDEISANNVIIIPFGETIASICWGNDDSTIYKICMWDDSIKSDRCIIRRILLEKK